jgi:predicted nucleotidyltransferase component of viral defense system
MSIDPTLFADVADTLGIAHPAIVEKDYYAIQLLKLLSTLETPDYQLVFAGGTCLAKAHQNTYRMSENIDIKLVPTEEVSAESRTEQRRLRRELHGQLQALLEGSELFSLVQAPGIQNEYRFQQFLIEYPTRHDTFKALRPHLQLELTESVLLQAPINASLCSLYAEVAKQEREVSNFVCVGLESTAAEKLVSLLRRTAARVRDVEKKDDPILIRHIYDLHLILAGKKNFEDIGVLVQQVIAIDVEQFGSQHPEFCEDPVAELRFGFEQLKQEPVHQQRYKDFIGPLVYHPDPVDWNTAFATLEKLVTRIF